MKTKTEVKNSYRLPIAMMYAIFFMIAFVTGLTDPMGVIVRDQFQASNFMSQLGTFANFIAYAFMGIPAGIMLSRIGYKKTALAAIAIGFTGVGVQFLSGAAESFGVYLAGAFISGFSMCMLNAVVNPMLNTLGGGGKRGCQLIQWGATCNSTAATITPVLLGYLMGEASERTIEKANPALFIAMGIFALAFIVLSFVRIPEPDIETSAQRKGDKHSPMSFRHFVLGIIAIFFYVGVEVSIPNIANLYMTSIGISASIAGTIVGSYWFLMMVGRFIGAALGAKFTSRQMLTVTSVTAIALILTAISLPNDITVDVAWMIDSPKPEMLPVSMVIMALCGLCTSIQWGAIFNLSVEGLGKYTAAASGIFMVMVCGGGILPPVHGLVADVAGYMSSYFVSVAGFAFILYYALKGSKNVNKDIKTE